MSTNITPPPRRHRLHRGIIATILLVPLALAIASNNNQKRATQAATADVTSSTSTADVKRAEIGETAITVAHDNHMVGVFKNTKAMGEYWSLKEAGADDHLLNGKLSCIVPAGTRVLVTSGEGGDGAFWSGLTKTSGVVILNGPHSGCRGTVGIRELRPE
jgi:hypothetical protein